MCIGSPAQEMIAHLPHLRKIMEGASMEGKESLTQFGLLAPPLGTARLKAVEVVAALLMTRAPQADAGLPPSPLPAQHAHIPPIVSPSIRQLLIGM